MLIKKLVKSIIQDFELSYPLDIYKLCKKLNIDIYREDIDMDGCLICHNGKSAIIVNKKYPNREKFSIAHELGHFFIPGHNELMFNCYDVGDSSVITKVENEREADEFASELLMPQSLIERYAIDLSFEQIKMVAQKFGTSLVSTAIRFIKLTDENSILIFISNNRVKWHVWSNSGFMKLNTDFNFNNYKDNKKMRSDGIIINDDIEYVSIEFFRMNDTDSLVLVKEYCD